MRVRDGAREIRACNCARNRDLVSSNPQEGQVVLGLSNPEFKGKWGDHYTRSLVCAHRLQQCHNYKDPSVQQYGGAQFKTIVDAADAAFCTLPAPKGRVVQPQAHRGCVPPHPPFLPTRTRAVCCRYPSGSIGASTSASYSASAPAPAVDMSRFMDRYGGCFAPDSPVALADGTPQICHAPLRKSIFLSTSSLRRARSVPPALQAPLCTL